MVRVIPADPSCVPQIVALEKECFSDAWSEGAILSPICQPDVFCSFVAIDDEDRVIGWICLSVILGEAEIGSVATSPAKRRQGIGTSLLQTALNEAVRRGAEIAYLEVRERNTGAQALYHRFGFTEIGRRRRYYRDPEEDAIVMTAKLL